LQDTIDKCLGLARQYNPLSVSKGVLTVANNVRVRRENLIEDRRGHASYATFASAPSKSFAYLNRVVTHYGSKIAYDNGSGTFTDFSGSYSAPTGAKMRAAEANSNLYVTTSTGVQAFSSLSSSASATRKCGVPRALDPSYTLTGSSGFLDNNKQCAYRVVLQRTDANSNVITGYPSQRMWVTNTIGGARNVIVTTYLPAEAVAGDVVQVYRTDQVTFDPITSTDAAGDEMGLVYQVELVAADITAGNISFTDSTIDELIGATLYTSPSQEGLSQANERPPLCKDLALFKSAFMFFANTQTKHRLFFTLVGTATLGLKTTGDKTSGNNQLTNVAATTNVAIGWKVYGTGIPAGTTVTGILGTTVTLSANATATAAASEVRFVTDETLTLSGTTYSFGDTEISSGAGSPQVQVSSSDFDAVRIDDTARSLVRVINRYASNTSVYAYYLSGPDDLPGSIMIEERTVGGSAFTLQASDANIAPMVFPEPPVSPATNDKSTSSNDVKGNRCFYSKVSQPEHVPLLNYLDVGPANSDILRVVALRDSLIFITEAGVYRLTGDNPQSFTVTPLDLTVRCKAADSVAVLANTVFMLSNQGVVSISDTGVQVVSRDIEPLLIPLLSYSNLSSYTTACAYESEREYRMATVSTSSDTGAQQTFVYNAFTRTWTIDTFGFTAGVVEDGADRMYFSLPGDVKLYRERKDFSDSDYADPESAITITAISGNNVTFTSSVEPEEGWVISFDGTELGIESLTVGSGDYTAAMDSDVPSSWTAGAATLYPSVGAEAEWAPWTGGQAGALKQVRSVLFVADPIVGSSSASRIHAYFRSDLDADEEEILIESQSAGWGDGAWGAFSWGGAAGSGFPTYVPMNKQYCAMLMMGFRHRRAREKLALAAVALNFRGISERTAR
jgi:hypothetical protein